MGTKLLFNYLTTIFQLSAFLLLTAWLLTLQAIEKFKTKIVFAYKPRKIHNNIMLFDLQGVPMDSTDVSCLPVTTTGFKALLTKSTRPFVQQSLGIRSNAQVLRPHKCSTFTHLLNSGTHYSKCKQRLGNTAISIYVHRQAI